MYWIQRLTSGLKRVNHAAVVIDNMIYSFGGYCSDVPMKDHIDIYVFNTDTLEWNYVTYAKGGDFPPSLFGHTAVVHKRSVYIWGGINNRNGGSGTLYSFDIDTRIWKTIDASGHVPKATDGHTACVIGDFMYVFGGFEADSEVLVNMLYRINLNTYKWERMWTKGTPPSPRDFHTASVIGNRMYIFGGRSFINNTDTDEIYYNEVVYLDTDTATWVTPIIHGQGPRGRRSHSAAVYNKEIYIIGGCCPDYSYHLLHLNDIYKFNPEENRWTEIHAQGSGPNPRRRHCSVVVGGLMFLFGGSSPILPVTSGFAFESEYFPPRLKEEGDVYIFDFCPSLKRLCQLSVIKYGFELECLPIHLKREIELLRMTHNPKSNTLFQCSLEPVDLFPTFPPLMGPRMDLNF